MGIGPRLNTQPLPGRHASLVPVLQLPASSSGAYRTMLNGVQWCPGLGSKVTWDARGKVYAFNATASRVLLDVRAARPGLYLFEAGADARSGGVRSFAEHPTRPGIVYTTTLETPGPRSCTVLSGAYPAAFHAMLVEWDLNAGTQREVLCITMFARYHPVDTVVFGPTGARRCYLAVGDGGYLTTQLEGDPYHQAQLRSSPLGKILRIDTAPSGNRSYTIPAGNPFGTEVWAYGLRHPAHLQFAADGSGGWFNDIGVASYEKLCVLKGGANYGWSSAEGDPGPSYTRPAALWDRTGLAPVASCGGPVVTSGPLAGNVLWGDMVSGRIFYAPADRAAAVAPYYELQLDTPLLALTGGTRCDMRLGTGSSSVLVTSKHDGWVRRLMVAP